MSADLRTIQDIAHIEHFLLENYDVHVSMEDDGLDEYWFDPNDPTDPGVVSISTSNNLETQLFVLLHEAGHVMLRRHPSDFPKYFPDSSRSTLEGRLEILKEEVTAWLKAQEIAEDLGIHLDAERWRTNYRHALLKYIEWVPTGE